MYKFRQCLQSRRALRAERTHAVRGQERAVRQPGRLNDIAPLGEATQFVVDHAPCPVLLVWPQAVPGIATIPPHARSPATPPPLSRRPGRGADDGAPVVLPLPKQATRGWLNPDAN